MPTRFRTRTARRCRKLSVEPLAHFISRLNHTVCLSRFARLPIARWERARWSGSSKAACATGMTSSVSDLPESVADLDALFRRYSRELNSYAYRRLKDREAAADVVQDGFLRFLVWSRERSDAVLPNGPRFFLWRVVGNLTIDLVRRNRILGSLAHLDD